MKEGTNANTYRGNPSRVNAGTAESFLLYLVTCGIFSRSSKRNDAVAELRQALHHVDPVVRCVAGQMLDLSGCDCLAA